MKELTIPQLFEVLEARHAKLKQKSVLKSVAVAINLEYVESDALIKPGDNVAIIPPVSGG
jgi:molybdopterin converting factor small subunit